jgi:hypothetical protein
VKHLERPLSSDVLNEAQRLNGLNVLNVPFDG